MSALGSWPTLEVTESLRCEDTCWGLERFLLMQRGAALDSWRKPAW